MRLMNSCCAVPADNDHVVQFYEVDPDLLGPVTRFLFAGLRAGDSLAIASTLEHAESLVTAIELLGGDLASAYEVGRLVILDAQAAVDVVCEHGKPDRDAFRSWFNPHLYRLIRASDTGRVRVFGELASLLARRSRATDAMELERLWNELLSERPISLYCAYRLADFPREADRCTFREVCCTHARVMPITAPHILADPQKLALRIAELEQLAATTATEVSQRARAEARLRETEQRLAQANDLLHELLSALVV